MKNFLNHVIFALVLENMTAVIVPWLAYVSIVAFPDMLLKIAASLIQEEELEINIDPEE